MTSIWFACYCFFPHPPTQIARCNIRCLKGIWIDFPLLPFRHHDEKRLKTARSRKLVKFFFPSKNLSRTPFLRQKNCQKYPLKYSKSSLCWKVFKNISFYNFLIIWDFSLFLKRIHSNYVKMHTVGFTLDLKLHLCYYSNVKKCVE